MGTPTLSSPMPEGQVLLTQAVSFVLTDTGLTPEDVYLTLSISYPSGAVELVYSPAGGFTALYAPGSLLPATLPGTYIVNRLGGWLASPTLTISAVDNAGGYAEASYSWLLLTALPSPVLTLTASGQNPAPYGVDAQTFLNLGAGPDMDPMLQIVGNPSTVMNENMLRRLLMAPGTLPYAPLEGLDVRQYINAAQTNQSINAIQSNIKQQILRDPRVSACTVMASFPAQGTLNLVVQGWGSQGPFNINLTVSALSTSYSYT